MVDHWIVFFNVFRFFSAKYFPAIPELESNKSHEAILHGWVFPNQARLGKVASKSRTTWNPQTLRKPKKALRKQHWQLTILKRHEFFRAKKTQLTALTADDSQNCQTEAESYWLGSTSQKSRGQKKRRFRIYTESPEMPCHPAGDEPALWGGVHPTYLMFETFFGESGDISHHVCSEQKNSWTFPGFLDTTRSNLTSWETRRFVQGIRVTFNGVCWGFLLKPGFIVFSV